nr:hypothetical protein Iba_chr03bCG16110 [Ipomoea batatas]
MFPDLAISRRALMAPSCLSITCSFSFPHKFEIAPATILKVWGSSVLEAVFARSLTPPLLTIKSWFISVIAKLAIAPEATLSMIAFSDDCSSISNASRPPSCTIFSRLLSEMTRLATTLAACIWTSKSPAVNSDTSFWRPTSSIIFATVFLWANIVSLD